MLNYKVNVWLHELFLHNPELSKEVEMYIGNEFKHQCPYINCQKKFRSSLALKQHKDANHNNFGTDYIYY